MMVGRYFLGADLGSTKTHIAIADEHGRVVGFGKSGPGNHETVEYEGMLRNMQAALDQALGGSGLTLLQISGAGFGIAGYDWSAEKPLMEATIRRLGLAAPIRIVNDATIGLVAGADEGWGVAVVSGTGCNCRGWDRFNQREGRVSGHGIRMGEAAGASELVFRAMQLVNHAWIRRGEPTALSEAFMQLAGASSLEDLIEGYTQDRYDIGAEAAPLVFQIAKGGDGVARELVAWAGTELGELANSVIRQLEFENLSFDVVLSGSMFEGGAMLIEPMRETIHSLAPGARLVRLSMPPVVGAIIIGMEEGRASIPGDNVSEGVQPIGGSVIRQVLSSSLAGFR